MMKSTRSTFILLGLVFILSNCISNYKDEVPDAVKKIESLSKSSDSLIQLILEANNLEDDSLSLRFYLKNNFEENDTLYHSSSFPLYIAYKGKEELTPPFEGQVLFDDLVITILPGRSKILLREIVINKYDSNSYTIVSVFRYTKVDVTEEVRGQWIISNSVKTSN